MISDDRVRGWMACARAGDRRAREECFLHCLSIVDRVTNALRRKCRGLEAADLWQEGCIALLQAVDSFDLSSPRPFELYARARVWRAEMEAILREYRIGFVLSRIEQDALMGVARIYKRLSEGGREPDVSELLAAPDLPRELRRGSEQAARRRLGILVAVLRGPLHLDRPREAPGLINDMPEPADPRREQIARRRAALERALAELPPRQRQVIAELYLGEPRTWAAAAAKLHLSQSQLNKARARALRRLRRSEALRRLSCSRS